MPDLNFKVGADISGLKKGLEDARGQINRALGSIGGVGGLLTAGGAVAGIEKAVSSHVDRAKDIAKLAQLANSSIAEASKLLTTGEQFGVTSDKLADALRNVSQAASKNPDLFKAIGVATEDANGKARPGIQIFNDIRSTLSNASNDYRTTAAAAAILGRSVEDLYPFLRASDAQVKQVAQSASDMGLVMSQDDVAAALAFAGSMQVAAAQGDALSRQLAGTLIPILANVTEAAFTAGDMLGQLINKGQSLSHTEDNPLRDIPILGGVSNLIQNTGNIIAGRPTDRLKEINDAVNAQAKIRADFAKLASANLLGGGAGGSINLPDLSSGGAKRDTVADEMRDHIDAVRAEAAAKDQAARDALQAYEREKQAAIETVRTESDARHQQARDDIEATRAASDARAKAHEREIDGLRSELDAREKQRNAAVAAIQEEIAVERAAFDQREEARQAERDELNAKLKAIDAASQAEQRASTLQTAVDAVATAKADEPVRVRSESLDEFNTRHEAWVKQVADAEARLADVQKAQADEAAREKIQQAIEALDASTKADRKATDSSTKAHDEQITAIQKQAEADRAATADKVAQIAEIEAAEKAGFDARIALMEATDASDQRFTDERLKRMAAALAQHVQTENDALEVTRRSVDAQIAQLEEELKNHQRIAASIQATHQNINRTITYTVVTNGAAPGVSTGGATGGGGGHITPFAEGGEGIITSPTLLVNAQTGQPFASVAESGPEPFTFGRGRSGGGRGPEELHVFLDGRELQGVVSKRTYGSYRMSGGKN